MKRVAVIGAGAAGLAAGKHLLAAPDKFSCTVFEQTGEVGGTWVYTDRVGLDEYGLPIHTSMYKSLRTNLPKEVMGFPDFSIPEQDKSYLPARAILQFLNDYADRFSLRPHIKFHHHVKKVSRRNGEWNITVTDLTWNTTRDFTFDAVLVCNGHYAKPYIPTLEGIEQFEGTQLHSHDYRTPDIFRGQTVLVVGAGPSGMDLTLEVASTAKQVIMSHHLTTPIATTFPSNVALKPDVELMSAKSALFKDKSRMDVDVVFYCTGFKYNFPFLSESCKVRVEDNFVQPLYKHLIHVEHPSLCFVGLPYYVCAFSLFDIQVRFFLKTLDGSMRLPSGEDMTRDTEEDMESRRQLGLTKRQAHMMGPLQGRYYDDLADTGAVQGLDPVLTKLHNESSQRFLDDLVHYREDVYKIVDRDNFIQLK